MPSAPVIVISDASSPLITSSPESASNDLRRSLKEILKKEFLSWSVCSASVSALTGLLLFLNIGLTIEPVTATLFYISLAGTAYFALRFILLVNDFRKSRAIPMRHELN